MPLRISRSRRNAQPANPLRPGNCRPQVSLKLRLNKTQDLLVSACYRAFTKLHHDQCGGAYTLSYVMVIPFTMLLIAWLVETVLMMNSKLGTVTAAYVAARSASVWSSADQWPDAQSRIEKSAQKAMAPFASGSHRETGVVDGEDSYVQAYHSWVDDPVSAGYLRAKLRDASANLEVHVERPSQWDSEIKVRVTYHYTFRVPVLGKLLGQPSPSGSYTFPLTTEVSLQNEGPQNPNQQLGIPYGSPD
jgi:Flp pilus assembly protein TadG